LGAIDWFHNQSLFIVKQNFDLFFFYCYLNSCLHVGKYFIYALWKSRSLSKLFPLM
jgi:hypothetical protein